MKNLTLLFICTLFSIITYATPAEALAYNTYQESDYYHYSINFSSNKPVTNTAAANKPLLVRPISRQPAANPERPLITPVTQAMPESVIEDITMTEVTNEEAEDEDNTTTDVVSVPESPSIPLLILAGLAFFLKRKNKS